MNTVVKKSCLILLLMSLLALPALAQNARVQFIHNSGDIDARTLDVFVGDSLYVNNFTSRTATPFLELPAGADTVRLSPGNMTPADSLVAEVVFTLNAGGSYVILIDGILEVNLNRYSNPDPANRNIRITLFSVPNVRQAANDGAKVEYLVHNGNTDGPAMDMLRAGTTTPLVDNLVYNQTTAAYLSIDPALYTFDLTASTDNTNILGSFEADLSTLAGKSLFMFIAGFVTPVNNQGAQNLALLAAQADGTVLTFRSLFVGPVGKWKFAGPSEFVFKDFFGADTLVRGGHGITVDRRNRIWIGNFTAGSFLRVFHPDGREDQISPIRQAKVGTDSVPTNSCRGMVLDQDGSILWARGLRLYRINSTTGQASHLFIGTGPGAAFTSPMVDQDGFIWISRVVGTNPINVIDPNTFTLTQEINLTRPPGVGRGIGITADASTIFTPDLGESGGPLYMWTTSDFINYQKTDSIYTNIDRELIMKTMRVTMNWHPIDSTLWVSVDFSSNLTGNNVNNGLYAFDFKKLEYKVLPIPEIGPGISNGPRNVAFSVSGDTAYAVSFNGNRMYRFVRGGVGVKDRPLAGIPAHYELLQNYPNPFNPSTTIPFTLSQFAQVELKIYDGLGRVVKTLVKQVMPPGRHEATFETAGLASGLYHYRLYVDGQVFTKSMMLLK